MKQSVQTDQVQIHSKRGQRGPFPWGRVLIIFGIVLVLSAIVVAGLLATTHNNSAWTFLAPVLISLFGVLVPVIQWLFPVAPANNSPAPLANVPKIVEQSSSVQSSQESAPGEQVQIQLPEDALRPATVFLACVPEDQAAMRELRLHLNVRGMRTWRIPPGAHPSQEIERAIEQEADAVALFITPTSLAPSALWDVAVPAALRRRERNPNFAFVPMLHGLSLAVLRQFCASRNLPDLTHFSTFSQLDNAAKTTQAVSSQAWNEIARTLLKATLSQRLRRVGADQAYEPGLSLHTWDYQPSTSSLDLDLNWSELIPEKERLPTSQEWEGLLLPALRDVKQALSAVVSSRHLHLFVQSILPVAFALGFTFHKNTSFALILHDQRGTWKTEGPAAEMPPLRSLTIAHDNSDPRLAVVELAISRPTERGVANALATLGLAPGSHLRFEPLTGPANYSITDNTQALAMARQISQTCHKLYDQQGIEHLHLFAACSASLAVLVGHGLTALCPITLYEFRAGAYQPAVTLR